MEWAILENVSPHRCGEFADLFGVQFESKKRFIKRMGSKAVDGKGRGKYKSPYMRKLLSERLESRELGENIRGILVKWITNGGLSSKDGEELLDKI